MKKTAFLLALAACFTSGANAQSHGYERDRHERAAVYQFDEDDDRYERREYRNERRDARYGYRDEHRDDRHDQRRYQRAHRRDHGAGPHHDIFRGERLPQAYWGKRFVVRDYDRYDLPEPAQGHYWVRIGNDFVSSSVHTGIIGAVMLGR